MRKVIFKKYAVVEGKATYPESEGWFHCWGMEYNSDGAYSVALIEQMDGSIVHVMPERVRFKTPWEEIPNSVCQ